MRSTRRRNTYHGISLRPLRHRNVPRSTRPASRTPVRRRLSAAARRLSTSSCNHSATMMGDVAVTKLKPDSEETPSQLVNSNMNQAMAPALVIDTSNNATRPTCSRSITPRRARATRSRSVPRRKKSGIKRRRSASSRKRSPFRSRTKSSDSAKHSRATQSKSSPTLVSSHLKTSAEQVSEECTNTTNEPGTESGKPNCDCVDPLLDNTSQNQCCSAAYTSESVNEPLSFLIGVRKRLRTGSSISSSTVAPTSTSIGHFSQNVIHRPSWNENSSVGTGSLQCSLLHHPCEPHDVEVSSSDNKPINLSIDPDSDADDIQDRDEPEDLLDQGRLAPIGRSEPSLGFDYDEFHSESQRESRSFSTSYSTQEDSIS